MSRFLIIWAGPTTPVTRYPGVRFIDAAGDMRTVQIYDAFKQNLLYMSGAEYVYPIDQPLGTYTVLVTTAPTYSRRVRVFRYLDVCSGVIRFDQALGLGGGALDISLTRTGSAACGPVVDPEPELLDMPMGAVVIPPPPTSLTGACPDLERAQQHRPVRQMVKMGQVPAGAGAASIFFAPTGPERTDTPGGPTEASDWARMFW